MFQQVIQSKMDVLSLISTIILYTTHTYGDMTPLNPTLYARVKELANKKFTARTGVYRSAWIIRQYKKKGGTFQPQAKSSKAQGLLRWFREKWVDLRRPLPNKSGYEPCGRTKNTKQYPLCRPSKRITNKTPKTYREIPKQRIAKAMREKARFGKDVTVSFKGGRAQYHGKKSTHMIKVPISVKQWATYAFKLKGLGFEGARETGWKRAKQLSTQTHIPIEDLRYMRNWFARHIITSYPGFKTWADAGRPKTATWHKKHAIIAWVTWGGDPALKWVNTKKNIALLNRVFNKRYTPIRL